MFFQSSTHHEPSHLWCAKKLREIQGSGYEFVSQYDAHNIRRRDIRGDAPKDRLIVLSK